MKYCLNTRNLLSICLITLPSKPAPRKRHRKRLYWERWHRECMYRETRHRERWQRKRWHHENRHRKRRHRESRHRKRRHRECRYRKSRYRERRYRESGTPPAHPSTPLMTFSFGRSWGVLLWRGDKEKDREVDA